MRTLPGFWTSTSDLQIASPQVMVDIDRDRALSLGVTPQQIQDALFSAYGTAPGLHHLHAGQRVSVILEVQPQYQRNPDALSKLYVRSIAGHTGSARLGRERQAHRRAAQHQPLRTAPGGHDLVQSEARLFARARRPTGE